QPPPRGQGEHQVAARAERYRRGVGPFANRAATTGHSPDGPRRRHPRGLCPGAGTGHGAIIRRYRNRAVAEWPLDADQVIRTVPALARLKLKFPAGHGRKARTAVVELRSKVMTLTPNNHVERQRQPLRLTMVQVREVS